MTRLLTRQSVWIVLLLALAVPAWAQTWPNEPVGSVATSDCGMNVSPCPNWFSGLYWGTLISDGTAPLSPPGVTQHQKNPNSCAGGGEPFHVFGPTAEVYVGLWAWIDPNFQGVSNGSNKIWRLVLEDGSNWWLEIVGTPLQGPFHVGAVWQPAGSAVDNCHLPYSSADCPGSITFDHGGPTFTKGVWHRLEVFFRKSTSPNDRTGVWRVHMDGVQIVNFTSVNTPNSPISFLQIGQAWTGPCAPGETNADEWRFDHVHVSTCTGCTTPSDQDGDGIPDSSDQCPTIPGPGPTGCPPQTDTIAPMPPDQFEVTRQGGPILPPPPPTGPSSGGDAGFMF